MAEVRRKAGIGQATCSNRKKKFGGLLPSETKRLRADRPPTLGYMPANLFGVRQKVLETVDDGRAAKYLTGQRQ